MMKALQILIGWAMSNVVAKILISLGFAIAGSFTVSQFIEYFINKALNQLNDVPMIGLLGIAGIDTAISILISSFFIRIYLSSIASNGFILVSRR